MSGQEKDRAEEDPVAEEEEYRISLSLNEEEPVKEGSANNSPLAEQEEDAVQEMPVKETQSEGAMPKTEAALETEAAPLLTAKISFEEPVPEEADPTPVPLAPDFAPDLPLPVPESAPDAEPTAPAKAPAETAALMTAPPETELLPDIPPEPRPKRRFRGLPGLHVEAYDNDIDVTAFHISIKL